MGDKTFIFERYKVTLKDGREVIRSLGRPDDSGADAECRLPEFKPGESYGWLGVGIYRGYEGTPGAIIREVYPDGPAAGAGFMAKDRIVEFDGRPVKDPAALIAVVTGAEAGSEVDVKVVRGEEEMILRTKIAQRTVPSTTPEGKK